MVLCPVRYCQPKLAAVVSIMPRACWAARGGCYVLSIVMSDPASITMSSHRLNMSIAPALSKHGLGRQQRAKGRPASVGAAPFRRPRHCSAFVAILMNPAASREKATDPFVDLLP